MIKIYNVKNHKLDSDKLTFLNRFNSNDFCGVAIPPQNQSSLVSDVFKLDSNGKVTINNSLKETGSTDLTFINVGTMIDVPFNDIQNLNLMANHFYYIKYKVNCLFDESNIYDDSFNEAVIEHTEYKNYIVTAYDIYGKEVSAESENCIGVMSNVTLGDNTVVNYIGKSITLTINHEQYYIIPLFLYNGSNIISLIEARNKSSFEQWLSAKSLDNLWKTLHKTFTHQSGSTPEHSEYGKLGNFNFHDDEIKHNDVVIVNVDSNNKFNLPTYKSESSVKLPYIDDEGNLETLDVLGIENGGTNASTKQNAKRNLGIYYGTSEPSEAVTLPEVGDIYFKILK